MKKLFVTLTALAVLTMSLLAVSASDVVETQVVETERNMDADTYLELRLGQLDEALANKEIEQSDYDLLVAHITQNAAEGTFGYGPNGYLNEDKEACVLGEDGQLGIFRNENSGMRNGQGNGVRNQLSDGSGTGSRGANRGQGNQAGGNGMNGQRLQDGSNNNEDCILD